MFVKLYMSLSDRSICYAVDLLTILTVEGLWCMMKARS